MGFKEVTAYQCEFCGRLFPNDKNYHEIECRFDPKGRTCVTCMFSRELVPSEEKSEYKYCPRKNAVFKYPCKKYCFEYVQDKNLFADKEK